MSLDPVATSFDLTQRYISYIKTTFFIRDNEIRNKFEESLLGEKFSKGPILEVTPPFKTGQTISSLIAEGVLSSEFRKLKPDNLPTSFYLHQEKAIRRLITDKRNIIAATGTGSGKTEIYLIPILNALMREKEKGTLGPGVRALLLYPMNALVNDQLNANPSGRVSRYYFWKIHRRNGRRAEKGRRHLHSGTQQKTPPK